MDGNRDEAERCIEIARAALLEAKRDKAEKFLRKAETLFPTPAAKELLAKLTADGPATASAGPASPKAQRRQPDASDGRRKSPGRAATERDYTTAQADLVRKIKRCKDFYEVLGIAKDAAEPDIKKAYKKLALQLHPDKNKAPGADEAFKAIGNAVATLTDESKRQQYDLYGKDGHQQQQTGGARMRSRFAGAEFGFQSAGFEADVTAEELFNMFFNGGYPQQARQHVFTHNQRQQQRQQQQQHNQQREQSSYSLLINMLPILLLITLSMMSSFFISDPIYSLQPSQKYTTQRMTKLYKVPYYVKENFHAEYQGSLGRLETSVEDEHINNLKHSCYRERNYKETMSARARSMNDRDLHRRAQAMTTPGCDALHKLQNQ